MVGHPAPSAAVVEAAAADAAADAEASSVAVLVEVHRSRPRAFRTNPPAVVTFVVSAACPAVVNVSTSTRREASQVQLLCKRAYINRYSRFVSVPCVFLPPRHGYNGLNSRASAVDPPQGKRVAAHGAGRRELSGGPGAGGAVRGFLLPQAGESAQPGRQREWYAEKKYLQHLLLSFQRLSHIFLTPLALCN